MIYKDALILDLERDLTKFIDADRESLTLDQYSILIVYETLKLLGYSMNHNTSIFDIPISYIDFSNNLSNLKIVYEIMSGVLTIVKIHDNPNSFKESIYRY